jgi:hypothetical protein
MDSVVNESEIILMTDSKASLAFSLTSILSWTQSADKKITFEYINDINYIVEYFIFKHKASEANKLE